MPLSLDAILTPVRRRSLFGARNVDATRKTRHGINSIHQADRSSNPDRRAEPQLQFPALEPETAIAMMEVL
jgi:hypothetical protein